MASFAKRTHTCGELREEHAGTVSTLNGWVHAVRNFGGVYFLDVRDRYGVTQVVVQSDAPEHLAATAQELRAEFVVTATGTVRMRSNPNPKIPTGLVEIEASDIRIVNRAEVPPFEIMEHEERAKANEELRLKYRYLDLRRRSLQQNFIVRNELYQVVHQYFAEKNFIEVETPVLMKSTPEGARDFLVPSRVNKGKFYALPQSPQLYKQILMVSGFDRYMQIVKCFRDEDLRADRQPEFTQVDIEMSFVDQNDIISLIEEFTAVAWKKILGREVPTQFPRLTWHQAMTRFGSDKPDTRYALELSDVSECVRTCGFAVFSDTLAKKHGVVAALNAKGCAEFSRKQLDELTEHAKKYGAKGLAWMKIAEGDVQSPIAKFLSPEEITALKERTGAEVGDLLLIVSDEFERCYTILGALRTEVAKRSGILEKVKDEFSFLWVVDFPLMEFSEEEQRYIARHHPFTSPLDRDVPLLATDPTQACAQAHDLVCNGYEIAGGSIRIHDRDVQQRMFDLLGFTREDAESKFGFLLHALTYGAPPHGGIALGFDRWVMLLCGTDNIRDVVAFPKTTSGLSLMDGCPSAVDERQLGDLGIGITASATKDSAAKE
ncbi:MAG: hypothetical protein RL156_763 [Bacteroidota bacterium]